MVKLQQTAAYQGIPDRESQDRMLELLAFSLIMVIRKFPIGIDQAVRSTS
jgi:hypothetical protein